MSRRREEKHDSSDSELEDYKYKYYKDLRDGKERVRVSEKIFRCPFCYEKRRREYDYKEILQHASRIGRDSKGSKFRDRAKHLGLVKYLERCVDVKGSSSRSSRTTEPSKCHTDAKVSAPKSTERASIDAESTVPQSTMKPTEIGKSSQSTTKAAGLSKRKAEKELIVWPWMAIAANIPCEYKDGRYVSASGRMLREEWVTKGYNPVKVHPLWNFRGHSGFAIVEFGKDWDGFKNAMTFEKAFEVENHGRRDWYTSRCKGDKLYAWIARDEDYNSKGHIGEYLRKNGDLKTVSDIEMEDKRKGSKLVSNLENQLETKNRKCEDLKSHISRTEIFMGNVMRQKEEMIQNYNEELKKRQKEASDQLEKILEDHEKSKSDLESQKSQLELVEKELKEREALNESEKMKLDRAKKMNERAILEQEKADENMWKLAEDHKREKEKLHKRIIELEKKIDAEQALELEIERLRGAIPVMKHMNEDGDMEGKKKMESIEKELQDKEEELEAMQALSQALMVKERASNDEMQEARKELVNGFKDSRAFITVKRMGELDEKPFHTAAKRKYTGEEASEKAIEWCSLWEDYLRNPNWHPFKVIPVGGDHKEIINEEDEKLKILKDEYGDEVYQAVTTALSEMNQYNASGRYPLPELWNTKEERKATIKEAVSCMLKQWRYYKRRKN